MELKSSPSLSVRRGKKLPAAEQKPVLAFLFLPTKVMYIHVYNTVSFSADTVINSTYHMQTEPGRKKTDLAREFKGPYLHFCMFINCICCTSLLQNAQQTFGLRCQPSGRPSFLVISVKTREADIHHPQTADASQGD